MIKFSYKLRLRNFLLLILFVYTSMANGQIPQVDLPNCSPFTNSINVSAGGDINTVFDVDMDYGQTWENNIKIHSNYRGYLQNTGGTFTHPFGNNKTVNFNPTLNFLAGEIINTIVIDGKAAVSGNLLVNKKSFSFISSTVSANAVFTPSQPLILTPKFPTALVSADLFNNNPEIDLAVVDFDGSDVYLLENNSGIFTVAGTLFRSNYANIPFDFHGNSICAADFNADGNVDIAVSGYDGFVIYYNNGTTAGWNADYFTFVAASPSKSILADDFDNDGNYDIAVFSEGSHEIGIFLNSNAFLNPILISTTYIWDFVSGDFNNDGNVDIVYSDAGTNSINFIKNAGGSIYTFAGSYTVAGVNATIENIDALDVDNDNFLDIVALYQSGNPADCRVVIFKNSSGVGFSAGVNDIYTTQSVLRDNPTCVSDYDGDGDMDFVIGSNEDVSDQIEVFINNGYCSGGSLGTFTSNLQTVSNNDGIAGLTTADYDNDGKMDIAAGIYDPAGSTEILINGGSCSGGNTPPTISSIPSPTIICQTGTSIIPFYIDDLESLYNQLTFSATSLNTNVIPNNPANISITPVGVIGATDPGPYLMQLNLTPINSGIATIQIMVTDGGALTTTYNFDVDASATGPGNTLQAQMTVLPVLTGPICVGAPLTFTVNVVNGGLNPVFQWAVDDGSGYINVPGANGQTFTFIPSIGGITYHVRCYVYSSETCIISNPATPFIKFTTYPVIPIVIASNPNPPDICEGECVDLDVSSATANGYHNFIWTPTYALSYTSGNGDMVKVCPQFTTSYTVTATDPNGCTNSASITINVTPNPIISPAPHIGWSQNYGGQFNDGLYTTGQCFRLTNDDGFVFAASTLSSGGFPDITLDPIGGTGPDTQHDIWVEKFDLNHAKQYDARIGGTQNEEVNCIRQTSDGGYILIGTTYSNDYDVSGNNGQSDIWVVKLRSDLSIEWQRCYGTSNSDNGASIEETYNGYVFVGFWDINGLNKSVITGIDFFGGMLWQETFPGQGYPVNYEFKSINKVSTGGFVIGGSYYATGNMNDYLLLKVDFLGNTEWEQHYNLASMGSYGHNAKEAMDGGYTVSGMTVSATGTAFLSIIKTDVSGSLSWQAPDQMILDVYYEEVSNDFDGGYLVGYYSIDQNQANNPFDYHVIKIDPSGNIAWDKIYSGDKSNGDLNDVALTARRANTGEILVYGITNSHNGDVPGNYGGGNGTQDVWVLSLAPNHSCSDLFASSTICQGATMTSSVNLSGATNIQWFLDGVPVGTQPSLTYTFNIADDNITHFNIVTVQFEINGCVFSCAQDINVFIGASVNAGADQTICTGASATLTATGSGSSFVWSNSQTGPSIIVSPTVTTVYTVTVTDASGCTASDNVTVTVTPLTVNAGSDQTICEGATASLSAVVNGSWPGLTYAWSTGAATQNITVSPTVDPTTYTVTVTSGNCSSSDNVTVNLDPKPDISITQTLGVSCIGVSDGHLDFSVTNSSNFSFTISGPSGYSYGPASGSGPIQITNLPQSATSNDFTLTVIDQVLATQCSETVTFTIGYGGPAFSVCASVLPCGAASGNVTINFNVGRQNPPTGSYTYTVTENSPTGPVVFPSGSGTINANETQIVNSLNAAQVYYVNVTDDNNCEVSSSFTVQSLQYYSSTTGNPFYICNSGGIIEIPINIWSNATTCSTLPTVTYDVVVMKKDAFQQYTILAYSHSTTTLPIVTPDLPVLGIGEYQTTVTLSNGCTVAPFTFSIEATSPIVVDVQVVKPLCHGDANGSATAYATGGGPNLVYEWYNATPDPPSLPTATTTQLPGSGYTVSGLAAGNYGVVVTDPNSGCTETNPVFFTVEEPDELLIYDASQGGPGCTSSACSASVPVQGGTAGYTFEWALEKTFSGFSLDVIYEEDELTPHQPLDGPLDDPLQDYQVIVYDPNNPPQPPYPTNVIYYNSTFNTYQQFVVVFTDYQDTQPISTSTYSNPEPGNYTVTVTDANGCVTSCNVTVEHPATPRTYDICFNWKTKSTEETPVIVNTQNINLAALAASDISQAIENAVQECIIKQTSSITQGVLEMCNNVDFLEDEVDLTYDVKQHHYTLYYYDRAGNLVRTVPPKGVVLASARTLTTHSMITKYEYNSLAQLIKQETPDGGINSFIYNDLNQLLFSQNAEQLNPVRHPGSEEYSYTHYDALGRIIEVGKASDYIGIFSDLELNNALPILNKTEQTFTVYSDPASAISYQGAMQRYLQNQVSYSFTKDYNGNNSYTYYSYDPHGNVEWLVQDIPGFGKSCVVYEYDLISNKVLKVRFNVGRPDQYFHRYEYDEDNRLLAMHTSRDGYLWDKDASYEYYLHGPLRRTEIGEDQIQGMDYTYTLQGWLKGINSPHLDLTLGNNIDYGKYNPITHNYNADGSATSTFTQDEFGMVIGYYEGDFKRTGSREFLNSEQSTNPYYLEPATLASDGITAYAGSLYNGNISTWVSKTTSENTTASIDDISGEQYTYDRLNRIKSSTYNVFNGTSYAGGTDYYTKYSYDANGNIKTLQRNGFGANTYMDELTYDYEPGKNRLKNVQEANASHDADYTTDIDANQITNNYEYDEIGNLIKDEQEGLVNIKWTVYGKIAEVIPANNYSLTTQKPYLKFTYDANGNRIAKHAIHPPYNDGSQTVPNNENYAPDGITPESENVISTYYVRDGSGNIMAVYERTNEKTVNTATDGSTFYTAKFKQKEVDLYGSERVGTYNPANFEIGTVNFQPGHFYDVSLYFDEYKRTTELLNPVTNSHTDDYFNSGQGTNDILLQTAHLSNIDLLTPDIAHQVSFLGITDNALATVEIDDATHTRQFTVAGADYWGASNTCLVYDKDNYLMMGSSNINTFCDEKSKPVIARKPGTNNTIYYLFTRDITNAIYYHVIDMNLPGNGTALNKLGEVISSAPVLVSSAVCGRHLAVIEDNVHNKTYVYFTEHEAITHETTLKRIIIPFAGLSSPVTIESLITYTSYDENGDGEIQIAPNGKSITIYNHLQNLGWFNSSEAEMITCKLSADYSIAYAANVLNANAWEPVVNHFALPDNNVPKGTFDYTADSKALSIAQTYVQNIISPTENKIVFTVDVDAPSLSPFLLHNTRVGDIRHLASLFPVYPNYHFEKNGSLLDSWIAEAYYIHDAGVNNPVSSVVTAGNEFLDGSLPYQPHRIFENFIEELISGRVVGSKAYELKDHLNNVRVTVSDARTGPSLAQLKADVLGINNYYPFGMLVPGRSYNAPDYRFGFQGQETDHELCACGNLYTAKFWEYDSRIARRWNNDPVFFAWESPYATFHNKPILFKDPDGDCPICPLLFKGAASAATDALVQFIVNMVIYDGDYETAIKEISGKQVAWEGFLGLNPWHVPKAGRVAVSILGDLTINYFDGKYDGMEGAEFYEQLMIDAIISGGTDLIAQNAGRAGLSKLATFLQRKGWDKFKIFNYTGVRTREQADIDLGVNAKAPKPMDWHGRTIGKSAKQNKAVQEMAADLERKGATDIRIDQTQVDANGNSVGINRPDLQYTLNGKRYYVEWDTPRSGRGAEHDFRIRANDANAGGVQLIILE